jgi:nucleoside-diphosphate-sugar epimerase
MRVFVTGASGYIGLAVVQDLINAGHTVVGLTRSDKGAEELKKAGAEVQLGTLDDLDVLRNAAAAADGVIHLAFGHGVDFADALNADLRVVETMGAALEGSGKPFVITAHLNGDRSNNALFALKGVRAVVVSLAPSVHSEADRHGFVPRFVRTAREKGESAYVGDGSNCWSAVHRLDAAHLFRLALEKAPNGSQLDGVGDESVSFHDIAEAIGRGLNVPVVSISHEEAVARFGEFLANVMVANIPRTSVETQKLLGWHPTHPGLIADIEEYYVKG